MRELLARLGNPESKLKIIHVAGTKGKGSTSAMIAVTLKEAGYRVGVYSSPHLERFEERIAINGQSCEADELIALINQIKPIAEAFDSEEAEEANNSAQGGPTFFDLSTAMALTHFANQQVDAVVLEVGLGGRLDSTNVCHPIVSVITSISRDHMKQLGETLGEIATEKAGIIKPGIPVVSGVTSSEPRDVIQKIANQRSARIWQRDQEFSISKTKGLLNFNLAKGTESVTLPNIQLAMHGSAQAENASVALATIGVLREQGWNVSWEACQRGIAAAKLPARMERFTGKPMVVLDGAHNEAAAQTLAEALPELAPEATDKTLLISIAEDKEAEAVLRPLLARFDRVIVTQFLENPRARDPEELARLAKEVHASTQAMAEPPSDKKLTIQVVSTPADAWCYSVRGTDPSGVIVVAGSFFLAAEVRRLIITERNRSEV